MNENKIRGLILGRYSSVTSFAQAVKWSRQKASGIICGRKEPSLDDIYVISMALGKDANEIAAIFLEQRSQKCVNACV